MLWVLWNLDGVLRVHVLVGSHWIALRGLLYSVGVIYLGFSQL